MFKYEISSKLLDHIKKITGIITTLNGEHFPEVILQRMEYEAAAQSSFSSTSIEGNPLPLTEVKKILKQQPHKLRDTEREVINYNQALLGLKKKLDSKNFQVDLKLILELQKLITSGLLPKHQSGIVRKEPVFVNDPKLRKTIYWPPDHEDVPKLMKDLLDFISKERHHIDPIILSGLFHKQFVVIHPFIDGNGRTVRLATKAMLADLGINTFHLFSFENYYNQNVSSYFHHVGVRGNYYDIAQYLNFTEWLEYFSGGILDELLRIQKLLEESGTDSKPSEELTKDQQKIIKHIKKNGYIRDKDYSKLTTRAKATRALDFKKLIQLGLLERQGKGPSTYYILKKNSPK